MNITLVAILLVFGFSACAGSDYSIENDFDELVNLVSDVKERIQSLRKNVKEELRSKCGKNKCSKKSCADGWVSYNGKCYFFDNDQACTYEEARAFCKQRESVLLYVQDEAENAFIVGMLGRLKSTRSWWMGLNDQQSEGYWKWTDTSAPANFIKWAPGQPEGDRKQNCVVYSIHQAHRWHDADCHTKYSVICKQEIKKKLKQTKITDFFG